MGTAFVAIADAPSGINFNPPGLVNIKGTKRHGGGIIVVPSREFKSPAGRDCTFFMKPGVEG
jgi:hypothetical protein